MACALVPLQAPTLDEAANRAFQAAAKHYRDLTSVDITGLRVWRMCSFVPPNSHAFPGGAYGHFHC